VKEKRRIRNQAHFPHQTKAKEKNTLTFETMTASIVATTDSGGDGGTVTSSSATASNNGNNNNNGRFETFTEAVPLSLSSMAHSNIPLDEGVIDGVRQILSHTMSSCVNYARIMYPTSPASSSSAATTPATSNTATAAPTTATGSQTQQPIEWSFRDLVTSPYSWTAYAGDDKPTDVPFALEKLNFKHQYCRSAFIYLKSATIRRTVIINDESKTTTDTSAVNEEGVSTKTRIVSEPASFENELEILRSKGLSSWQHTQLGILGRITLQYISTEELTPDEMHGTSDGADNDDDDTNDMPPCLLYKIVVEYRSLPASGKEAPILAEELSMLSFGGSIDDDVKYGALASLYDAVAKYVLEIYSVRGKKYKFDLMDSTLSDGTVPRRLPPAMEGHAFAKCLCVTVTNHNPSTSVNTTTTTVSSSSTSTAKAGDEGDDKKKRDGDTISSDTATKKVKISHDADISAGAATSTNNNTSSRIEITRIHFTLEGKPRIFATSGTSSSGNSIASVPQKQQGSGSAKTATAQAVLAASTSMASIPSFEAMSTCIASTFINLNPNPPLHVSTSTSGHRLLLDPLYAGHIYINGRYITTWNDDVRIGSNGIALYGMDLQNIVPVWQGRIIDFESLRVAYAQLWHELLVDSKVAHYHLSRSLLYRLMKDEQQRQSLMIQRTRRQQQQLADPTSRAISMAAAVLKKIAPDDDDDDGIDDYGQDNLNRYYDDDDEEYDNNAPANDTNAENGIGNGTSGTAESASGTSGNRSMDVNVDCLETQVLGRSVHYDPVGIAAKALATRFALEFGNDAYPCLSHETTWVRKVLPNRRPIIVPERLIAILRRGGYFTIQQTCNLWFDQTRPLKGSQSATSTTEINNSSAVDTTTTATDEEIRIASVAISMLEKVGCTFVDVTNITVVTTPVQSNVVTIDDVCRYDENTEQFFVHENFFQMNVSDLLKTTTTTTTANAGTDYIDDDSNLSQIDPLRAKGYLLGMYIAKAHPYGKYLAKYVLRNRP
jgi:hypothetical protein